MAERKSPSEEALNVIDSIATNDSSKEIVDAIKAAFYSKAMNKLENEKREVNQKFFDADRDDMKYVKTDLPKKAKDSVEKTRQNDKLLATGDAAAGNIEPATQYKGEPDAGMGWMNKLGKPMKPWGGDRRPGVGPGAGV